MGRRQPAEEVQNELRALAERTGNIQPEMLSASVDATLAVMDGRLEDAMGMVKRLQGRKEEISVSPIFPTAGTRAQLYTGAFRDVLKRSFVPESPEPVLLTCLLHALSGRKEEASEILEKSVVNRPGIGTVEGEGIIWEDALFLEASVNAGHLKAVELLFNQFAGRGLLTSGVLYPTCIPRHLGGASSLLGNYDEARKYYQQAIKVCTEMPFRPELALSRLQLAELLLEHYTDEKKEALEHLDFAIKEFREMKMQPSLERALRHKDILKA
jgi:tetratricopeptide (TPR) repeat protein